jgi:hypothetical protein
MTTAEEYRRLAAELRGKARFVEDRSTASEWNRIAQGLQQRGTGSGQNELPDLIYEPPTPKLSDAS